MVHHFKNANGRYESKVDAAVGPPGHRIERLASVPDLLTDLVYLIDTSSWVKEMSEVARWLVFAQRQRHAQIAWQVDWGFPIGAGLRSIPGPFDCSGVRSHGKALLLQRTGLARRVGATTCCVSTARAGAAAGAVGLARGGRVRDDQCFSI